jgi:hypothetical protein
MTELRRSIELTGQNGQWDDAQSRSKTGANLMIANHERAMLYLPQNRKRYLGLYDAV